MTLPAVPFGKHEIKRLILGGNPLCGNSHCTNEMNEDMREYYTQQQVLEVLRRCEEAGINTIQARGDYHRVLHWMELFRREGGNLQWIAQTASEMHDVFQNIRILAAAGAIGIYHHGTQTDRFWHEGRIDEVGDYLKCMRDCGVMVGLGTHRPDVIRYAEEHDWDVDFYMACFYNLGRSPRESALVSDKADYSGEAFLESDREEMCQVIRQTSKTCLAFKILAASRNCATPKDVREAFQYAFDNIKPQDAVVVGMFTKYENQIALNIEHTLAACGSL
ncbi:MAG: hypothetical protein KAI66_02100 [Lentisphaeria bacterium]|nr:hypothetical protein [Lentisphaeria bacterium]